MNYVFDLDGTICFDGKTISRPILNSLHTLLNKGHRVVFASARSIRDMLPVLPSEFHDLELIGANGVLVSEKKKVSQTAKFTAEQIKFISITMEQYQVKGLIDDTWHYHIWQDRMHPFFDFIDELHISEHKSLASLDTWAKVLILSANNFDDFKQALQAQKLNIYYHQNEQALDICPNRTDKFFALQHLTNPITKNNYIAFGNDNNDHRLLENALSGYKIGHHILSELKDVTHLDAPEDVEKMLTTLAKNESVCIL